MGTAGLRIGPKVRPLYYEGIMSVASVPLSETQTQILTPEAVAFLNKLARTFEARRQELLARREVRQQEIDAGKLPDFLPETASIRDSGVDRRSHSRRT